MRDESKDSVFFTSRVLYGTGGIFWRAHPVSLFQFDRLTVLQVSCGRIENPTFPSGMGGSAWLGGI
jgi:hypothetical protein